MRYSHGYCHSTKQEEEGMCTSDLFSEDGMIGLLEQAVMLLKEVHVYAVWHKTGSRTFLDLAVCDQSV